VDFVDKKTGHFADIASNSILPNKKKKSVLEKHRIVA